MWPGWCSWRRASGRRQRGRSLRFPRGTWRRAKNTAPLTWTALRPTYSLLLECDRLYLMGCWSEPGHLCRWEDSTARPIFISQLVMGATLQMSWRLRGKPLSGESAGSWSLWQWNAVCETGQKDSSMIYSENWSFTWTCSVSSHRNSQTLSAGVSTCIGTLISIWYLHFLWFINFFCLCETC